MDITKHMTEAEIEQTALGILSKPFPIGHAILLLKLGEKVSRTGWNGKGMWLKYVTGDVLEMRDGYSVHDRDVDNLTLAPWIGMKTADNKFVPWLASQSDILAEDWVVVE